MNEIIEGRIVKYSL